MHWLSLSWHTGSGRLVLALGRGTCGARLGCCFPESLAGRRFVLDEDSYLVPELDGVRIFSRTSHEFLHEIPGEPETGGHFVLQGGGGSLLPQPGAAPALPVLLSPSPRSQLPPPALGASHPHAAWLVPTAPACQFGALA